MLLSNRNFRIFAAGAMAMALLGAYRAEGALFTGDLTHIDDSEDGFIAEAQNASTGWRKSSILSWVVSNEETGGPSGYEWAYEYTIDVEKFAAVRWVIETGPGFIADNISNIELSGTDANPDWEVNENLDIGTWDENSIDGVLTNMPAQRFGILLTETSIGGQNTDGKIIVSFWSDMEPMWGDLYANCGGNGNRGWNQGFTLENPNDDPDNGSIYNHVLVPTPEPSAFILLLLGSGLLAMKRRL